MKRSWFPLLRFLPQGAERPAFWGVAWVDWRRPGAWIAPLPLNLLLACGREVFARLHWPSDKLLLSPAQAYLQGRHDQAVETTFPAAVSTAAKNAWNEGYRAGYTAGKQSTLGVPSTRTPEN